MADLPARLKRLLIVAPYWCDPQHLGSIRIERFVRWLSAAGARVVMVAGGDRDELSETAWGTLVTVRDPLGIYRTPKAGIAPAAARPHPLRWLAYALFNPDPGIVWGWRAARHPLVARPAEPFDLVLSSSFPESAHVVAARLAQRCGAPLVVDMRDGWLDEPMKPLLRNSRWRRLREGALERRILEQAAAISVTSGRWRDLLAQRLPSMAGKITVVTNAYPCECAQPIDSAVAKRPLDRPLTLLYAGRIFTSRAERRVEHLLAPLLAGLQRMSAVGTLAFLGKLGRMELDELERWRTDFERIGWQIACENPLPRAEARERMQQADGLLLLSSSVASIPAKLFDYLCARRPILAVAPAASAVADLAPGIRQMFLLDYRRSEDVSIVEEFVRTCRVGGECDLPAQFGEAYVRDAFVAALASAFPDSA